MGAMIQPREIQWLKNESVRRVGAEDPALIAQWSEKLLQGMPLAYVLGYQPFLTSEYVVTPDVLIPRPETEFVVEHTIKWLEKISPSRGAELGIGSGAIS